MALSKLNHDVYCNKYMQRQILRRFKSALIHCEAAYLLHHLPVLKHMGLTMIIFTLWVTGLGLLSSSSITLLKWLSCQIGWPSWFSLDS